MKIQLDYDNTTITIQDHTNLGEFFNKISKLLPDWEEWKLISMTYISNWSTPIQPYPYRLWYNGTLENNTNNSSSNIYNISNGTITTAKGDKEPYSISGIINLNV